MRPAALTKITKLISAALKKYPDMRFVVPASPDYLDGLLNIGFYPMTLSPWNYEERTSFVRTWGEVWNQFIDPQLKKQVEGYQDDYFFLRNWITSEAGFMTPLDWTLRIWSIYSGDSCGPTTLDAVESFVNRTTRGVLPRAVLSQLALECIGSEYGVINRSQAEAFLSGIFNAPGASLGNPACPLPRKAWRHSGSQNIPASRKAEKIGGSASRVISTLISNEILAPAGDDGVTFIHPTFMGYLASLEFNGD